MPTSLKPCPICGYENRSSAWRCGLCGKPFVVAAGGVSLASDPHSNADSTALESAAPTPVERIDFAHQMAVNRNKSVLLLAGVFLILILMGMAFGNAYGYPEFGGVAALVIAAIYVLWAYFGGRAAILAISSAQEADPVRDRQLINLVDEMRIAAGLPMPKVYTIESDALNAFATGRDPDHAAVAVTRGLINKLNREELQGVVAHEMSHIRNYDIRLMMLVAALVGAVVLLADIFGRSLWYGGSSRRFRRTSERSGSGAAILALIGIVFMILAPLFASLLQMAISRRREFLADASAVELTRNPHALATALEKIDNALEATPLPGASRATQHIYIANPLRSFGMRASALWSTHPPTAARIKVLQAMG